MFSNIIITEAHYISFGSKGIEFDAKYILYKFRRGGYERIRQRLQNYVS